MLKIIVETYYNTDKRVSLMRIKHSYVTYI